VTKNKPSFTSDDSLKKMLYLASKRIVEHWSARCRSWDMVSNYLDVMFGRQAAG
jgi:transposase-like protein